MADEQAVCERLDFGGGTIRHSANGKKHEVLLRLEASGSRGGIAFAEKLPDVIAELGHGLVLGRTDSLHGKIISYNDMLCQKDPGNNKSSDCYRGLRKAFWVL